MKQKNSDMMINFIKAFETDPLRYLGHFLLTLETNKLEEKYQEPDAPQVFKKEYDEFGLVRRVSVNKGYETEVPMPKADFYSEDYQKAMSIIFEATQDNEIFLDIYRMLRIGKLESKLQRKRLELRIDERLHFPLATKVCDVYGIPIEYKLNFS